MNKIEPLDIIMGILSMGALIIVLSVAYAIFKTERITDKHIEVCMKVCGSKGIERIEGGFRPECWCAK